MFNLIGGLILVSHAPKRVLGLKGRTREHGSKFGPRVVGIKTRTPFPFKTSDNMLFIWKLGPMSLFKSSDIMWLTKLGP
uniref:Uncharacterized protein n=1 Tax=Helianthus annuus TaxID=4232 RepID=A0A251VIZ3_HELAN